MPRHARVSAAAAAAAAATSRRHGTRGVGSSARRWCSGGGGGPTGSHTPTATSAAATATTTSPSPPVPPPRSAASAAGNATAPEEEAALSPLERALRAADRAEQLAASHTQTGPVKRLSAADTWATTEAEAAPVPQTAEGAAVAAAAGEEGVMPVATGGSVVGRRAAEKAEVARVEKERAMQALAGQRADQVAAWYKESRKTSAGMLAAVVRTKVGASGPEYLENLEKSWVESKAWDLYNMFMIIAILAVTIKLRTYESKYRYFHEILERQRQDIIWEHMVFDEGTREKNLLADYGWYFKWKEKVHFRKREDRLQETSATFQAMGTNDPRLPYWDRVKMESAITRNWFQNIFGYGFQTSSV